MPASQFRRSRVSSLVRNVGARSSLLLGGLATLAVACGSSAPVTLPPASPSQGAASTSAPPTAALATRAPRPDAGPLLPASGASGDAWEEPVVLPATNARGRVRAVAAGPDGWVAVGGAITYKELPDGNLDFVSRSAVVWTSSDGVEWTVVDAGAGFDGSEMFGIAWTSHGFIAVGNWKDEQATAGDPGGSTVSAIRPTAWRSIDGAVWEELEVEGVDTGRVDTGRINDVVEVDGILIGVGCLDEHCLFGPAMWVGNSFGDFRPVSNPSAREAANAFAVAATREGIVAVGTWNSVGTDPWRAAAWHSPDGGLWTPAESIEDETYATLKDVARSGQALVAVGSSTIVDGETYDSRPAAWRSVDDGRTWQRVGKGTIDVPRGWELDSVVWTGRAFVSVGILAKESPNQPICWVSEDGSAWRAVDMHGTAAPIAIVDGHFGLVAVGGFFGPGEGETAAPVSPLAWRSLAGE